MDCHLENKDIQEIESKNILQQTSFWARVKYQQGIKPYALKLITSSDLLHVNADSSDKKTNDLLVLLRQIDQNNSFAYIPYGPVIEPDFENHGIFLEELSEVIRPRLPKDCRFIRYDLPWENQWAAEDDYFDDNGNWIGPPPTYNQEFRINFNTNYWNLLKSPSDNLPTSTYFLNLSPKCDEILKNMKPKTRYNIRLSYRKGVRVNEYGIDKLDEWYKLYKDTAKRNGINLHKKKSFATILNCNGDAQVRKSILMAEYENEPLAAMFLVLSKNRGTYLYGASSSEKRNFMGTYAVQWAAIKKAREFGCKEYDMFGTAPNSNSSHPLHGLYRFKKGFGGNMYHSMGCWDYPLNKNEYMILKSKEINAEKYHTN